MKKEKKILKEKSKRNILNKRILKRKKKNTKRIVKKVCFIKETNVHEEKEVT